MKNIRLVFALAVLSAMWSGLLEAAGSSAALQRGSDAYAEKRYAAAYESFLPMAEAGVREMQNVVGFMTLLGRGVQADPAVAHHWFHEAAENGSVEAMLNLATVHRADLPDIALDDDESRKWMRQLPPPPAVVYGLIVPVRDRNLVELLRITKPVLVVDSEFNFAGRKTFKMFCAGCHGFDGMAMYPGAPSFLMGERLHRSNDDLKRTVLKGKNMMPSWEDVLSESRVDDVLFYLRAIALMSRYGLLFDSGTLPDLYYIFYRPDML